MKEFIKYCREGNPISGEDKKLHKLLTDCSYEAQKITMELNNSYHTKEEITELFERLTGEKIDPSFMCFPPFILTLGKI